MSAENIISAADAVLNVYSNDTAGLRSQIAYMKRQAINLSPSTAKFIIRSPSGSYTFEISDDILINGKKIGKKTYNKARKLLEERKEDAIGAYTFSNIRFSRVGGQEWSGRLKYKNNSIIISNYMPMEVL